MNQKLYRTLLVLFLLVVFSQVVLATALFYLKTGFSYSEVLALYRADLVESDGIAKSFFGLLEGVLPHILTMGLLAFTMAHFLPFLQTYRKVTIERLSYLMVFAPFLYNLMPFLIVYISPYFIWGLLISMVVFQISLFSGFILFLWELSFRRAWLSRGRLSSSSKLRPI